MNPYVIIAIVIAIDVISIPFFIKSILKKNIKRKGAVIALSLAAFIAVEAVFSFAYIDSKQFYDREGNAYTEASAVIYYDREGKEYHLSETSHGYTHFISTDGKQMYISERVYLDGEGYIVYDREDKFKRTDREYVYLDSEGNEYFLAEQMKWNRNGKIDLADK